MSAGGSRKPTLIERAFVIARSGAVISKTELSAQLGREGYDGVNGALSGKAIGRQIAQLIREARSGSAAPAASPKIVRPRRRMTFRERVATERDQGAE